MADAHGRLLPLAGFKRGASQREQPLELSSLDASVGLIAELARLNHICCIRRSTASTAEMLINSRDRSECRQRLTSSAIVVRNVIMIAPPRCCHHFSSSGNSRDRLKMRNSDAPAETREAEEDWSPPGPAKWNE